MSNGVRVRCTTPKGYAHPCLGVLGENFQKSKTHIFTPKQPTFLVGTPIAPALQAGVPYDLGTN